MSAKEALFAATSRGESCGSVEVGIVSSAHGRLFAHAFKMIGFNASPMMGPPSSTTIVALISPRPASELTSLRKALLSDSPEASSDARITALARPWYVRRDDEWITT
mmetsp:Transcript_60277/g.100062  ORF Transcript_60277/g.100062 Transcript_60277/m.100062 type:complete len:107 (-) Transcript_60277:1450-1770(-)